MVRSVLAAVIAMAAWPGAAAADWWGAPIERAALRLSVVHEDARAYSTAARPREVAGAIAMSCAYQEGRPCGNGEGLDGEVDAAGGYGAWVAAAMRVRLRTGRAAYGTGLDLDRAYVRATLGPVAVEVGRDVVGFGALAWAANAPPIDHVQLSGARPLALAPWLRVDARYVLGRLADPQTYPDDLVSMARGELVIADRVELGGMQLLQLGGDGAPRFGLWDFVVEHVRRRDYTAGPNDSSNRRVGADLAVRFDRARVVYQVMFEDLRKEMISALRYDADHRLAIETRWGAVELRKTGERSHEHTPRVTGLTQGGAIVGDPLGPAALAAFASGRVPIAGHVVAPWAEIARLGSDGFFFGDGPVKRTSSGASEVRLRLGACGHVAISEQLTLEPEAAVEAVRDAAFVVGARRYNALVRATLVWRPASTTAGRTTAAWSCPR